MACTYRAARVVATMGGLNMGESRVGRSRWWEAIGGEGEREREIYQQLVPALTRRRKLERYCISEAMIAPRLLALNCIRSLQEFSRHYDASSSSSSSLPFLSSKHPSLFRLLPPRELAILQRVPSSSWADLETIEMILHASGDQACRFRKEFEDNFPFLSLSFFHSAVGIQQKGVSLSKKCREIRESLIGSSDSKMNFSSGIDVWIR